ncbi:MAG: DUF975 family protein [Oscillospiraceae bacterium]|nr:DUF975 family protein [Oscillospiraceae bacterium]
MDIRNVRELKGFAGERVGNIRDGKRIVLTYGAVALGLTLLVTVVNYVLGLQIDQLGGLRNLGMRKILSTVRTVLPMVQSMVAACLGLGFTAAMLRVARGQYVSVNTLRLGFDRFWLLLRCTLFKGLLLTGAMMLAAYLGIMIYMMTPLSRNVMELLTPYVTEMTVMDSALVLEEAVYDRFVAMLWPAYLICGVLMLVLAVPMLYSYRMVNYIIIDKPGMGALAALRESKKMMRYNRLDLFKLDVSMWWYYLATVGAMLIGYGDVLLPMVGVELPFSQDVGYFVFYGLYLAATFGIYYFLLEKVEVTYGLAYDTLKPEEKQDNGVVLGNIFQM